MGLVDYSDDSYERRVREGYILQLLNNRKNEAYASASLLMWAGSSSAVNPKAFKVELERLHDAYVHAVFPWKGDYVMKHPAKAADLLDIYKQLEAAGQL